MGGTPPPDRALTRSLACVGTHAGIGAADSRPRVVLREADADDIEELVTLCRAFYDESAFSTATTVLRGNFEVLLSAANARIVVAADEESLCAFALTTTSFTLESGRIAELQDLYVRPEHRRRGIAALLIEDAAEWGRGVAASSLDLVIAPNGLDVSDLFSYYEARGFVNEERRILSRPL